MNFFRLSWKNLMFKPWNTGLSLLLFALGVGLVSLLLLLNRQLQDKFEKNLAGIDLVIGAKGSPLQLILSSMYHIDSPTGNVPISKVKAFLNPGHPLISQAIPISLGDSHRGYRIVGTSPEFPDLYNAQIALGESWSEVMEVTVGAAVADALNIQLGDTFKSSHGLVEDDDLIHHDAEAFVVVGIFEPTGAVIDQLILTSSQSVWAVHDHEEEPDMSESKSDQEHEHEDEEVQAEQQPAYPIDKPLTAFEEESITSILVKFKGRNYQALNMQRSINENTDFLAATPAIEMNRLYSLLGVGTDALRWLAFIIIAVSGLSVFISLYSSLRERRYELALMRTMGSSRSGIFALILIEGILLALSGALLGLLLSHLAMELLAGALASSYRYSFTGWTFLPEELWILGGALLIGLLAALIPALQASRTNISDTLSEG